MRKRNKKILSLIVTASFFSSLSVATPIIAKAESNIQTTSASTYDSTQATTTIQTSKDNTDSTVTTGSAVNYASKTISTDTPQSSNENIALNKPATASSYIGENTPAYAFDDDENNTRFESEYSDPQWISVDLGSDYNITGVELKWEIAAGKDYIIQVSEDNVNWVDAYTNTDGSGGTDDITFAPVTGRYVRMYGTSRTTQYGYSLWDFKVFGTPDNTSVTAPSGLTVTSTANNSVSLSWTAITDAIGYNIYRSDSIDGTYIKLNSNPISENIYTDISLDNGTYYYKVSAVSSNDESTQSPAIEATSTATVDFGPNVKIFDPSMSSVSIQNTLDDLYSKMETNQFGGDRYALFFKPGTYNNDVQVGFYTSVLGLGQVPDDVNIIGAVRCDADWFQGNATQNFWRSVENLAILPQISSNNITPANTDTWAVSQAAPMRRVHIKGGLSLWDPYENNYDGAWSSGGFIADSKIDGQVGSASQQQFFTRNSNMDSWNGANWNMVFAGDNGAPTNDNDYLTSKNTVIDKTSKVREKPFLTIDTNGNYSVFVPDVKDNSKGISWETGIGAGTSIPISQFFIAKPDTATTESLNNALNEGKNIIFTPGIYHLSGALNVTKPNTVILGLGYATLTPDNGTDAIKVSDVDGVKISGLLFDAGEQSSPQLLQIGESGSSADHSSNPTTLSDLAFRVGGDKIGKADSCMIINSNDVIGDDFWIWRADHGAEVGWNKNTCNNGLIVNGNDVTIYGLFVEHFNQYQTLWNGNGGKVYFYQSEIPYDVPSQSEWMSNNGTENGYASYKVSNSVTDHQLYGAGVYSNFTDAPIIENSAIEVPNNPGVKVHHACSVFIDGKQTGEITHIVNNNGATATAGANMRQSIIDYNNNVDQPIFSPKTSVSVTPQQISISCGTPGSIIRYTTDGTDPTETNGTIYTGPFTVSSTTTVKAIGYKLGMADSTIANSIFTVKPEYANDLAIGKNASASSGNAALAFDGDTTTRWETNWDDDEWISVDLGSNYNVTGAKLVWETAAAKDYKIQVSTDNINWDDAYTETNGTGGTETLTFKAPVNGRYVRMKGLSRTTQWGYSLWEFEVYGNK